MKKYNLNNVRFRDYYNFYRSMGASSVEAKKMAKELIIKEDILWYFFIGGGIFTFVMFVMLIIK